MHISQRRTFDPLREKGEIMAEFFASNLGTIIVLLILAAVVFLIVRSIVKDKKKGKSTCGSNCAHCAMSGTCHGK